MSDRDRIEIYQDKAGAWRWKRIAGNGEVIAVGEGHTRRADAERAAERVFEDDEPEVEGGDG